MLRCLNQGVAITLAAIDLGASVIERHFTLDRHQVNIKWRVAPLKTQSYIKEMDSGAPKKRLLPERFGPPVLPGTS